MLSVCSCDLLSPSSTQADITRAKSTHSLGRGIHSVSTRSRAQLKRELHSSAGRRATIQRKRFSITSVRSPGERSFFATDEDQRGRTRLYPSPGLARRRAAQPAHRGEAHRARRWRPAEAHLGEAARAQPADGPMGLCDSCVASAGTGGDPRARVNVGQVKRIS